MTHVRELYDVQDKLDCPLQQGSTIPMQTSEHPKRWKTMGLYDSRRWNSVSLPYKRSAKTKSDISAIPSDDDILLARGTTATMLIFVNTDLKITNFPHSGQQGICKEANPLQRRRLTTTSSRHLEPSSGGQNDKLEQSTLIATTTFLILINMFNKTPTYPKVTWLTTSSSSWCKPRLQWR